MLALVCLIAVAALTLQALVSGFRRKAFKFGRRRPFGVVWLANQPIRYWALAVGLSIVCGLCLGAILFTSMHGRW